MIAHVELPGYEADDLIGTLQEAEAQGLDVFIVTGDCDALQLVDDRVTVLLSPQGCLRSGAHDAGGGRGEVLRSARALPELAALVGETSDNLPGVPGVGPKTAAKWLTQFDGLDNIVARAEQVPQGGRRRRPPRRRLQPAAEPAAARFDPDLYDATARRGLGPRAGAPSSTRSSSGRRERLLELAPAEPVATSSFEVSGERLAADDVAGWLDAHAGALTAAEFVGHWGSGTGDVTGVALAAADGAGAYIDTADLTPRLTRRSLPGWPTLPAKAVHGAKGPTLACWARGWDLVGVTRDTLLLGGTCCGPGPAHLRPGGPLRPLPPPRSGGGADGGR